MNSKKQITFFHARIIVVPVVQKFISQPMRYVSKALSPRYVAFCRVRTNDRVRENSSLTGQNSEDVIPGREREACVRCALKNDIEITRDSRTYHGRIDLLAITRLTRIYEQFLRAFRPPTPASS